MTIKLIGFNASPNTLRVLYVLKELEIPYEYEVPSNFAHIKSPEFLKMNPFGRVPVLIDGDFTIYESRPICHYLIREYHGKYNSTLLIPSDIRKASLVGQYLSTETCDYTIPVGKIVMQEVISRLYGGSPDPEKVKEARVEVEKVLDIYEKILEGKDYLVGEFSFADISHCPGSYLAAVKGGHKDLWDARPNVKRWIENLFARDAWKKTLEETGNN
ncbi:11872_t:CDS:2 [Acaulospora morrowiae]|uniref:glutathione transferase n=1 Tax=Acaulospora morrowiae TaxID=94023 RepID=A0A9N9EVX9_9GLOM|nr:11872_t:CDS:2 [Acaulospora morrowiae]